jgi:AcrR family transcriptional regulator
MTIAKGARGTYAKTAERRRTILAAGLEVFSASGFRNGSIKDIAEAVGMSQAGLLHHFSNKNELLAGVLQLRDEMSQKIVNLDTAPGLATIAGFVQLVEYNSTVPGLVELHCVLSAEATSPEHPAHDYFIDRYAWVIGFTTEAFTVMQASGQLKTDKDPETCARGLVAMVDGLQVQWLLDGGSVDMAQQVRLFLEPLLTVDLEGRPLTTG